MTVKEAKIYIRKELSDYYSENELSAFVRIIFSDIYHLSSTNVLMNENTRLLLNKKISFSEIISRLKKYEPLQYIIGFTEFYGLKFNVNSDVLIPRPETEELVDLIIEENKILTASTASTGSAAGFRRLSLSKPEIIAFDKLRLRFFDRLLSSTNSVSEKKLNVLDIGTGSGCIAVSLAKNLPQSQVFALDVSKDALKIAESNALENNVELIFIQEDILNVFLPQVVSQRQFANITFDIIVSNPPYVRYSEKSLMEKNVVDYEPELALFVENDNPLIFYEAITKFAKQHLSAGGKLYFEINESFGKEVKELLVSYGFKSVKIMKDINGKDRMVTSVCRHLSSAG